MVWSSKAFCGSAIGIPTHNLSLHIRELKTRESTFSSSRHVAKTNDQLDEYI